ncbi:TetR/AcrR family transcriptional regulator [Pendulispora albinea]|uniref:TetR/AcrR family transcriptional regulator n=1 Tax=Pendulispora albinea TaxID=2741071 RepID=A0ABZ2MAU3_9BACT
MARPREFEFEEALQKATEVFWSLGYGGASVDELIKGTGLARGSLYKAFGDKRTLFLMVMDRYVDQRLRLYSKGLFQRPGPIKEAIRQTMLDHVKRATGPGTERGCLVTNTATEIGVRDPDVALLLARMFRRMEELFAEAIARGKAAGEIAASKDERAIARFLVLTTQGVRVMSHMRPDRQQLVQAVEMAVSLLS